MTNRINNKKIGKSKKRKTKKLNKLGGSIGECSYEEKNSKSIVELLKDGLVNFPFYDSDNNVHFNFIDKIPQLDGSKCKFISVVKIDTKWKNTVESIGTEVKKIFGTVSFEELFRFVFIEQELEGIGKFLSKFSQRLLTTPAKFDEIQVNDQKEIYFKNSLIVVDDEKLMLNKIRENIFDIFLKKSTIQDCKKILDIINYEISLFYNSKISEFKPNDCRGDNKQHCDAYDNFLKKATTLYDLYEIYKTNIGKHRSNIKKFLHEYWGISNELSMKIYDENIIGVFPISIDIFKKFNHHKDYQEQIKNILNQNEKSELEDYQKQIKNTLYHNRFGKSGTVFWRAGIFYPGITEDMDGSSRPTLDANERFYTTITTPFSRDDYPYSHKTAIQIDDYSVLNPSIFLAFCTNIENGEYEIKDNVYNAFALYHEIGHHVANWQSGGTRAKIFNKLCEHNKANNKQIQYVNIGKNIVKLTDSWLEGSSLADPLKVDDDFLEMIDHVIMNNKSLRILKLDKYESLSIKEFKEKIMKDNKFLFWLFNDKLAMIQHGVRMNDLVCDVMAIDILNKDLKKQGLKSEQIFEYIVGAMKFLGGWNAVDNMHFHWFRRLIFSMFILPELKSYYDKSYKKYYKIQAPNSSSSQIGNYLAKWKRYENEEIKKKTKKKFLQKKWYITLTPNEEIEKKKFELQEVARKEKDSLNKIKKNNPGLFEKLKEAQEDKEIFVRSKYNFSKGTDTDKENVKEIIKYLESGDDARINYYIEYYKKPDKFDENGYIPDDAGFLGGPAYTDFYKVFSDKEIEDDIKDDIEKNRQQKEEKKSFGGKKNKIKKSKKLTRTRRGITPKSCKKKSKKLTKITRKHQGIIQAGGNRGRLKKGYKYSGQRTKSGLPIIIKIK